MTPLDGDGRNLPCPSEDDIFLTLGAPGRGGSAYTVQVNPDEPTVPYKLIAVPVAPEAPEAFDGRLSSYQFDAGNPPQHLSQARNIHVIVSTRSGTGLALAFFTNVLKPVLAAIGLHPAEDEDKDGSHKPGTYSLLITSSANSVRDFGTFALFSTSARAPGAKGKTVILLSGDGGVVDLLNADLDASRPNEAEKPVIALIPLGTGNALFHSLQRPCYSPAPTASGPDSKPIPLVLALRTLFHGAPAALPSFHAEFSPGAVLVPPPVDNGPGGIAEAPKLPIPGRGMKGAIVASYGFHASLVWESDTPALRKFGDKRFGMAAAELLKLGHEYEAEVRFAGAAPAEKTAGNDEDKTLDRKRHAYVLATLVSNLEKTFTISPDSRPLDGQLRVVHFAPVGAERMMQVMGAAYQGGQHVGMAWGKGENGEPPGEVGYEKVEQVEVIVREQDSRWRKVCVDGTIVELEEGGWMRVRAGQESRMRVLMLPRVKAEKETTAGRVNLTESFAISRL